MSPGKILIFTGVLLLIVGVVLTYGPKFPFLGKIPGDIRIEKDNFTFYFPLGTCILVSLVLSLIFWLFRR